MTKTLVRRPLRHSVIRHSSFVILSSLVIRHSTFHIVRPRIAHISLILVVSERADDAEHFFEGDEASTMDQLVFVDGGGQFFRVGRQLAVAVRELPAFGTRRGSRAIVVPAINEPVRRARS